MWALYGNLAVCHSTQFHLAHGPVRVYWLFPSLGNAHVAKAKSAQQHNSNSILCSFFGILISSFPIGILFQPYPIWLIATFEIHGAFHLLVGMTSTQR
jgi:hypothetical protein